MRLFGLEITRAKDLSSVPGGGGWWPLIRVREPYGGAWQRNDEWTVESVAAHSAVFTCVTLISSDIGKLRAKLVEQDANGIWSEVTDRQSPFLPVLRKPNRFQNRIQFYEWWATSKLLRGNAYVLLDRDRRGIVRAMYLLDPNRVKPLVAPDGSVFYQLQSDNLVGLGDTVVVPAADIIHDRINCLFHPLVGISPIYACGAAANMGLSAQRNSAEFFGNDNTPSGILTAPGVINQATADEMAARWKARPRASVAVMGNGLKFEQLRMTAEDSQMIEQMRWTDEAVARAFRVPAFKIGAGQMPTVGNGEILDGRYYSDCLQSHIEQMELALDEGLGLTDPKNGTMLGVEFDLDGLLRMDTATQMDTLTKGVRGGVLTPNGARRKIDEKPLEGGDTIYLQHQDYPMEQIFNRTDLEKPEPAPAPPPEPDDDEAADDEEDEEVARAFDLRARTLRLKVALR